MRKKILHLTNSSVKSNFLLSIAKLYSKSNYELFIGTYEKKGELHKELEKLNIPCISFNLNDERLGWLKIFHVFRYLKENDIEIVHVHTFWVSLFGLIAAKLAGLKIISIEPEKDNFKMCLKNTKNYDNIIPMQKALSNNNGEELYIKDSGLGSWGFTTVSKKDSLPESNKVLTINIDEILNQNNWDCVDIVKIDIEGAEKELFESNYEEWIPKTKCIIIELHDRMKKGCSKYFFKTISQYNFSCELRGENLILINLELL